LSALRLHAISSATRRQMPTTPPTTPPTMAPVWLEEDVSASPVEFATGLVDDSGRLDEEDVTVDGGNAAELLCAELVDGEVDDETVADVCAVAATAVKDEEEATEDAVEAEDVALLDWLAAAAELGVPLLDGTADTAETGEDVALGTDVEEDELPLPLSRPPLPLLLPALVLLDEDRPLDDEEEEGTELEDEVEGELDDD
jgi:hypothetical protein